MASRVRPRFDREKAIEIVLYVAHRIADPTFHSICKILYFADRQSLERYGRLLCGDTYYAMKFGAVPSNTYRLLKDAEYPQGEDVGFGVQNRRDVVPFRTPDLTKLSQSDRACLDDVISKYGESTFKKRTLDSHDHAWWEAWKERGDAQRGLMTVESIAETLENADELLDFLLNRHGD